MLVDAGYAKLDKPATGGRIRTWVRLTDAGLRALRGISPSWNGWPRPPPPTSPHHPCCRAINRVAGMLRSHT